MKLLKFKKTNQGLDVSWEGDITLNGKSIDVLEKSFNAFKSEFLKQTYPIGSLYISQENVSPASLFGGTWEQLAEGYTLWTTTTSGEGGKKISAGLPNLVGFVDLQNHFSENTTFGGALKVLAGEKSPTAVGQSSYNRTTTMIKLDASLHNTIYGSSNTVQPPAVKTYMWTRIS